jgi:hypothetical protein
MDVQGVFPLTHWHSCTLTSIQGVFNPYSKVFMCTHTCSGGVQCSLKGNHKHSQVFRGHSVLTHMIFFLWSHHDESHSIMTQWCSCALNRCSHSLNCIHAHSMGVQGLFLLTHWHSCYSMGVQGLFALTHWHSCALTSVQGCSI